jgi:gamma-glutamylcyclotransferase (GGCT)/AIG2-like uncharacterized protein YtfP
VKKVLPLFVYGTLAYDRYARAITGRIFPKRPCVLDGYERIAPPHGYAYIIPRKGCSVKGYLLDGVDERHLGLFDKYEAEGDMYQRKEILVKMPGKKVRAFAYVVNRKHLGHYFAPDVVGRYYADVLDGVVGHGEDGHLLSPEEAAARRELLGGAIEEMLQSSENLPPLPKSEIRRIFLEPCVPTLRSIRENADMRRYADAYILFAVRHIILNQLEEKVAARFRDLLPSSRGYYEHAASTLVALTLANAKGDAIERLIGEMDCGRLRADLEYTDHALYGVRIANLLFDYEEAEAICRRLAEHRQPGGVPLGAELEFSPLGARAIGSRPGEDPTYDGFYYFHDFDLLRRGWKLGMYVDNHKAVNLPGERSRGFLEYALGRCRIHEDVSKPVTDDPWLLAQLIREAAQFCHIKPHSLHISLDVPSSSPYGPIERAGDLVCLLLLGGDIGTDAEGIVRERRIFQHEIEDEEGGLYFSRENTHCSREGVAAKVMEYQFPRLAADRDYVPLIMALKGFQLAGNPHPVNPFMDGTDYRPDHPLLMELKRWAESPRRLADAEIRHFVDLVERGLYREDSGKPAHNLAFIRQTLQAIARALRGANSRL